MTTPRNEICIIDCGSDKVGAICSLVEELSGPPRVVSFADADRYPLSQHDGVVISGGPLLFTGEDGRAAELAARFRFIDDLERPTLGICLGHQALGVRHGVAVHRGAERRDRDRISFPRRDHELLQGLGDEAVFSEDHCEGISLPPTFELLGSSEHYHVEIMASTTRPLFGVQFHPEVSGEPGRILMTNFVRLIREDRIALVGR